MTDSVGPRDRASGNLAIRIGLASALGVGALVTGFILTRPGRKLVTDVLAGRSRTTLEARVLDALWSDRHVGRRKLEVREMEPGRVALLGAVRSAEEVDHAVAVAERTQGVHDVEARLKVEPREPLHARLRPDR